MKVKYNVKGVDSGGGPKVKPGTYIATVDNVEVGESKAKDPMMTVTFKVVKNADGSKSDHKGQTVRNWILLDHSDEGAKEAGQRRLRQFLEAVGVVQGQKGESGSLDTEKVKGTEVQISVKSDKDQDGEYTPKIGKMFALDADADAEDAEPEEDDEAGEDEEEEPEEDDSDSEDEEEDADESEEEDEDEVDLDELDRAGLREFVKENNVSLKGREPGKFVKSWSDEEIRKMIAEAMSEEEEQEAPDYDSWDQKQLKAELKERGIDLDGKFSSAKAKKALQADDASDKDPF